MLTKPGIIFGNVITALGGFALASKGTIDLHLFFMTLVGLSFVIASAGVFNNYIDRQADAKMERTKDRAFAKDAVPVASTLALGALLGVIGLLFLYAKTNVLTVVVAVFGFLTYLTLYAFLKYRTFYGTLVGSLAGAVPPVVGYCAVSNRIDAAAGILFMILVLWQMPHFFSIAVYRLEDYAAASIPVLPVAKGLKQTRRHMLAYIAAFIAVSLALPFLGYVGQLYSWTAILLGSLWFLLCFFGSEKQMDRFWGRRMFFISLVVILGLCLTIPFAVFS